MKIREIGEKIVWRKGDGPIYSILGAALAPAGLIYGKVACLRERLYRQGVLRGKTASAPVVSIGNITLGGSGKTPLVIHLAGQLQDEGFSVAVLTRGHGGGDRSAAKMVSSDDSPASVGDEALLMARLMPDVAVVKCPQRADGAELARRAANPDIYLLDDGFGHIQLKRDVDVVIIDVNRGLGSGRVFPAGPLREPLSALGRADVIMARQDGGGRESGEGPKIEDLIGKYAPQARLMRLRAAVEGLVETPGGDVKSTQLIENKRVLAISGIGNPASFDQSMKTAGIKPVAHIKYPDHHIYNAGEIRRAIEEGGGKMDAIITTEKDLVRFPGEISGEITVCALKIRMEIEDEQWLFQNITSRITRQNRS